jgi:hypothetical protein
VSQGSDRPRSDLIAALGVAPMTGPEKLAAFYVEPKERRAESWLHLRETIERHRLELGEE